MSVIIQTNKGDLTIDLLYENAPVTCENFISLCKIKYFNNCLFFNIQRDFMVQSGDPTNTGKGGHSVYSLIQKYKNAMKEEYDTSKKKKKMVKRYFDALEFQRRINKLKCSVYVDDEIQMKEHVAGKGLVEEKPVLKHNKVGMVGMANLNQQKNTNASQFYITTTDRHLEYLDVSHTLFGEVSEGLDVLKKINEVYSDANGTPLEPVRILHTVVLVDPFEDEGLFDSENQPLKHSYETFVEDLECLIPPKSPDVINDESKSDQHLKNLLDLEEKNEDEYDSEEEEKKRIEKEKQLQEELKKKESKSRAVVLEMIGDLPSADVKPPENVLFVCKLNPATTDDDLKIIFSRFGKILNCDIIKDKFTNESKCYGFIEFETKEACSEAYFKMENVLIDDRRIHIDFSQSFAKLWSKFKSQGKYQNKEKKGKSHSEYHSRDRKRARSPRYSKKDYRDDKRERRREYRRYSSDSEEDFDRYHKKKKPYRRDNDRGYSKRRHY